jgi:hypothetical protein
MPFLEPDEEAEVVFFAMAGLNPWLVSTLGSIPVFVLGWSSFVTIATTDRANIVLRNAWMSAQRPTEVLYRGPRESLGDPSGIIYAKTAVGGQRYWVHRRFHSDVRRANGLLADPVIPPAPQPQ